MSTIEAPAEPTTAEGSGEATRIIGHRRVRLEDPRLLSGEAQYTDDLDLPGALHLAVLRSPVAHARIEQAQCGWMRRDVVEFHGDSVRNGPLFTAGVDEHQVFLPIVKKSKVCLAFGVRSTGGIGVGSWCSHGPA